MSLIEKVEFLVGCDGISESEWLGHGKGENNDFPDIRRCGLHMDPPACDYTACSSYFFSEEEIKAAGEELQLTMPESGLALAGFMHEVVLYISNTREIPPCPMLGAPRWLSSTTIPHYREKSKDE